MRSDSVRFSITRLALLAVAAIAIAAALDAIPSADDSPSSRGVPTGEPTTVRGSTEPLHLCRPRQLAIAIELLGERPSVTLNHISGRPCHVRPMRIAVGVRGAKRERVAQVAMSGSVCADRCSDRFGGAIDPATGFVAAFTFSPKCGQRGPFTAHATVGPYSAKRRLPRPVRGKACG